MPSPVPRRNACSSRRWPCWIRTRGRCSTSWTPGCSPAPARVRATGIRREADGGLAAAWLLSRPEQRASGVAPVTLRAHYGATFHHPHLRGGTVGEWPLNVFDAPQAAAEVATLLAIAAADVHNLVYQRDYRIIPAVARAGG
ncbi:MAG: hypothetical protein AVDCRST_MAG41-562 [uncultured Corynebacteriales bacterium]|uniref:Uncharacterized protein n=1 Tax=uncultured Mycobacteriales bacterium TaxID=581187 RepID=A0A6J4HH33_9ACTN|nr:MAG: hypothetical protein AVDCRST_MAG41-562 [uncultured Corynebacteriales bacterium]